ncbi:hypothetical protein JW948_08555 [bacterium]|nr:hypothetical protein [bacterium]
MTVKDSESNVLMQVNDEGEAGSITMWPVKSISGVTASKLYNYSGTLYWDGSEIAMAGSAGGWTDSGSDVILTTITDNVGIGTGTPEFKLNLDNDGGILAAGTFGSGTTLSTSGAGTRMIWYPRKSAIRAGYVDDTQWYDINIVFYLTLSGGTHIFR